MDLDIHPEEEAFRQEVRSWLEAHVPRAAAQVVRHTRRLSAAPRMGAHAQRGRLRRSTWPGRVRRSRRDLIAVADLRRGILPRRRPGPGQPEWHLPARADADGVRHAGTEGALSCRAWPRATRCGRRAGREPNAGSDMAAIRATARTDGDDYVLNGQKTWCSRGAFADWLFGMFRTDPDSERHHGLTFILVPLDAPGVTVRPIAQLDGETGFAEVFFDDVRVPVANRLGAGEPGLEGGHGDGRLRARSDAALPARYPEHRPQAGRALQRQCGTAVRSVPARRGRARLAGTRKPIALTTY